MYWLSRPHSHSIVIITRRESILLRVTHTFHRLGIVGIRTRSAAGSCGKVSLAWAQACLAGNDTYTLRVSRSRVSAWWCARLCTRIDERLHFPRARSVHHAGLTNERTNVHARSTSVPPLSIQINSCSEAGTEVGIGRRRVSR